MLYICHNIAAIFLLFSVLYELGWFPYKPILEKREWQRLMAMMMQRNFFLLRTKAYYYVLSTMERNDEELREMGLGTIISS